MEVRLKNLEVEIAYLRKEINELIDIIANLESEKHYHYTNMFLGKEYLDSLNDFNSGE